MLYRRLMNVFKYGWIHANQLSKETSRNNNQLIIFLDIVYCYYKYGMWSNHYLNEKFNILPKEERNRIGNRYLRDNSKRLEWEKEYNENCKFLVKFSNIRYEVGSKRIKRKIAYTNRFNIGKNLDIE